MTDRFVLVGLVAARRSWGRELARWASTAALPIELHACASAAEVRARLSGGRAVSGVLVDGAASGADADLVATARERGVPVLVVDDPSTAGARRAALDADGIVELPLERSVVADTIVRACRPIDDVTTPPPTPTSSARSGDLVVVTGGGGSGTTVCARALAEGWVRAHPHRSVTLADLALHADQALLHHTGDVVPGLPELLDAARRGAAADALDDVLVATAAGHRLLMGLRRHRDWSRLRPRSVQVALDALCCSDVVVADCDPDVEGVATTGSVEVEERNLLAREATRAARVVLVTARATTLGLGRLADVLAGLADHGVDEARTMPVLVGVPRRPRERAALVRVVDQIRQGLDAGRRGDRPPPLLLPHRSDLEATVRDGRPLPSVLGRSLAAATASLLDQVAPTTGAEEPEPIRPGSLGTEPAA